MLTILCIITYTNSQVCLDSMNSNKLPNFASKYFVLIYKQENIEFSDETYNLKINQINNPMKIIDN